MGDRKKKPRRGNAKQQTLPSKTCVVCGRAFTWRKKWARDWDNVKYCSKACAAKKAD
ncbi:MAG: DUF2256 domain-containing protein [Planctomycetota bacterium]